MREVDLMIKNAHVVTVSEKMEVFEKGMIIIDKGIIIEIGNNIKPENFRPKEVIDAKNKIVMPGLINTHTHIPMAYFKGLADDLPLHEWLQNHIWPTEAKFLSQEFVYDSSLHGIAELIKNGVTFFYDMYFFGDATAQASQKIGCRALIGEGVLDFPTANYTAPEQMINYAVEMNKKYHTSALVDFAIAPHSIYTCSEATLKNSLETAQKEKMLLHLHLSETKKEVDDCLKNVSLRPVEYLKKIGFLGENINFAHSVWIDENEQKIIADSKTNITTCTESNLKLASGFAPMASIVKNGINVSLGTDGVSSNNNLSILEEMDFTAKVHKAINLDPTLLPAEEMIKMATINAAKTVGKSQTLGSLEVGKKADLIIIDNQNLESKPMYNVYSHLVYNQSGNHVTDVIIDGKVVMRERSLLNIDEQELLNKSEYYCKKIRER